MKKNKICPKKLLVFLLMFFCFPFIISWENVNLRDVLSSSKSKEQERLETEGRVREELSSLNISALAIIQKMNSAMYETNGLKCTMDVWLQHPVYHANIHLDEKLEDMDKAYLSGKTSLSLLIPGTKFSTSEWIQSYTLGSSSYVYNSAKCLWEKEKIKLSKEKELENIEYGIFQSLAAPKSELVLENTASIISLQKIRGRDCFVVKFNLDPSLFKKWGVTGKIDNCKAWIDRSNYLPYLFRLEGSIGDLKFLQIVEYFDTPVTLTLPAEIAKEKEKENKELVQKTEDFIEKIKSLMGGEPPEGLKTNFINRKKTRAYIKNKVTEEYDKQELVSLEIILKWLNLIPEQLDYKEMLINSVTSSIGGFYEPKEKTFYIADWIPDSLVEPVLSHELIHAFQDNKIDLENYLKDEKNLDRLNARKFLIEGEATAVMLQFVFKKQGKTLENENDLLSVIKDRLSADTATSSQSAYSNLTYSGYAYGARFFQKAVSAYGWMNLDKIYKEPPKSMKELMHPEIYFLKAGDTKEPQWNTPVFKEWKKFYQNSLGEFFIKEWLEECLKVQEAEDLSKALKNDEIVLYKYERQKVPLILFLTEWNSEENAKKFSDAFGKRENDKLKKDAPKEQQQDYEIWRSENKVCFMAVTKKLVLIASGPALNKEQIGILLAVSKSPQTN